MVIKALKTALLVGTLLVAQAPGHAGAPGADEAAVAKTMRDMFAALAVDDEKALRGFWTSDFYAYDGGTRLDAQGLIDYVKGRHASGVIYTWSVPDPKVHIQGDLATITYENEGTMTEPAAGCVPMVWLEGAILLRQDGRWRIEFIHSTRAPAAYNAVHGQACPR